MPWSPRCSNGRRPAYRGIRARGLMAAAKHRAIDHLRRNKAESERKHEELGRDLRNAGRTKPRARDQASAQQALAGDDVGDWWRSCCG